jgi:hypothetical protein
MSRYESRRPANKKREAAACNAWAEKLRADAAKRQPALPAPVITAKEWKK